MHTHIHTNAHALTQCFNTQTLIHTPALMNTCTQTHTNTHTHTLAHSCSCYSRSGSRTYTLTHPDPTDATPGALSLPQLLRLS